MDNKNKKIDPIRKKYYKPLEIAEKSECIFFYVSAIFSLLTIIISKEQYSILLNTSQAFFSFSVIALCITSIIIRLYLAPRAQEHRYKDFLSHAYGTPHYEQTKGYYNNKEIKPFRRIAAQMLENTLYSKNIIKEMVKWERIKIGIYVFVWLFLVVNRKTELSIILIATQIIFSELLLLRWLLTEWLKIKFEKIFENLFGLYKNKIDDIVFETSTLEMLGNYETAKANGSITLSEKIFLKKSEEMDQEWKEIRKKFNI